MKVIYKPFALVAAVIGAKLGQRLFRALWMKVDGDEPPEATAREASLPKVIGSAALEAAALAGAKAATTRASARSFHYLTGFWPGEEAKAKKEEGEGR